MSTLGLVGALSYCRLIAQIDLPRLLQKILERGKNQSANILHDIKEFLNALKASDPENLSKNLSELQRDIQGFQHWEPQTDSQHTSTVPSTIAKLIAILSICRGRVLRRLRQWRR
jgi:hypothetical protein